jgi:hypothetical protein
MFISKPDVTAVSGGDGNRYEPDDAGVFDVPAGIGEWLIRVHGWEPAEPPAEPSETPKRKPAARKATTKE